MNLLNSVLVQLSAIHPFTQILCVVTLAFLAIVFLWNKLVLKRKRSWEESKAWHPFFKKYLHKQKTGETQTNEETPPNRIGDPVRNNAKKGEFYYPESTESQTRKRQTLERVPFPIPSKQSKFPYEDAPVQFSYLNKEKNDSEPESREIIHNTAKATPYFGNSKHSNPLHEAAPITSSFSMASKAPKPSNYYMDTPSKKKEHEIEQKRVELPGFSANNSAFKKFEIPSQSEKPSKPSEKPNEKPDSVVFSGKKREKVDKRELLLKEPIKIHKKGQKSRRSSEDLEEERGQKVALPTKRIKKELTKEKLAEIKKRRKNYDKSEDSSDSDSSFDDRQLPVMPNRNVFLKKVAEADKKDKRRSLERKSEEPEKTVPKKIEALIPKKQKKSESIEKQAREKPAPKEGEETFQKKKVKPNSEENVPSESKVFGISLKQNNAPIAASPKEENPAEKPASNSFMNSKNVVPVPAEKDPPAKLQETSSVIRLFPANNHSPPEDQKPSIGVSKPSEEKKPLFAGISSENNKLFSEKPPKEEKPSLSLDSNQDLKPALFGNSNKNSPMWGSSDSKKPDSQSNEVKITPFSNSNSETKGAFSLFGNNNTAAPLINPPPPEIKPATGGLMFGASAPKENLFGNNSSNNPFANNQPPGTNNTNTGGLFSNLNNNNAANNNSENSSKTMKTGTGLFANLTPVTPSSGSAGFFPNAQNAQNNGLFGNNIGGENKGMGLFSGLNSNPGALNNNVGGTGIFGNFGK